MLDELRASLDHLETLPVDVLERQLRGCLDLFAYRLDAWITSLATRRLDRAARQTRRAALVLGGFGWVHDLAAVAARRRSPRRPGEDAAPLFARARARRLHPRAVDGAGVGRGRAAQRLPRARRASDGAGAVRDRPLARRACGSRESLLDGVRQGQPLGALLGYRFERGLHDRQLDRFIAGFRRSRC